MGYNLRTPNARPTGVGHPVRTELTARAKVAELVDALALGASGETRESSSLSFRTSFPKLQYGYWVSGYGVPGAEGLN